MSWNQQQEQAAVRGLLLAVRDELGHAVAGEWQAAALAAPRHRFLPELIWLRDDQGRYMACDRLASPEVWFTAAYADDAVVTQVNDGEAPAEDDEPWPSSSASAPSVVFRMLEALDLSAGMKVLEIGTGTGLTAAYLAHRLGDSNVVTVEVDEALAERARATLKANSLSPSVICADGQDGWKQQAPYDRVSATCSVTRVPIAWIEQTKPGGVILTPWDNPWICWGLLRLAVRGDGAAEGRFSPYSAFMTLRAQRQQLRIYRDVVRDEHRPDESSTGLDPRLVAGESWEADFAVGHRLGDVWYVWHDEPEMEGVQRRLWLATTDCTSWAAVDWDGDENANRYAVWQYGSRHLWDEAEAAYGWWGSHGRPGPERFGLTVNGEEHRIWLDAPENGWTLRG
ncbi:methyltransferase domain-containing protein [Kitasatospora sp. NPDC058218]|uniref:methyltransferase domain-containing protein n=1 Tax=Kitasatospora sp. NPDC058218 TaxID=3346385 RepID=UPI0036D869B7